MIARLATELHCYLPEQLDETWAHLRHLGRRRAQLITAATASVQRIRDFLSVAWPTVTGACAQPLESVTWLAALQVVTSRCGGQPGRLAGMGADMAAVLAELGLSRLADIPGLTAVGAAAILAETGDPRRYDSSSSLVKHAGLSPSDNSSGAFYLVFPSFVLR
jgi:transposase